jgi:hypothetical protein
MVLSPSKEKKVIIVIGGLVGAGKTSLAKELNRYYTRYRNVCVLRLVAYSNVSYLFFDILAKIFYGRRVVKNYERVKIHPSTLVAMRVRRFPPLFAKIIIFVEIFSLFLWNLYKRLKCFGSQIVIIDEGFVNVVANYLEVLGKNATPLIGYVLRLTQKWYQKHRTVFLFVTSDYDTLIKRWSIRKHPIITSFIDQDHHIRYMNLMLLSLKLFLDSGFNNIVVDSSNKDVHMLVHKVIKHIDDNICK